MALIFTKQPTSMTSREGVQTVFTSEIKDTTLYNADTGDEAPEITCIWEISTDGGENWSNVYEYGAVVKVKNTDWTSDGILITATSVTFTSNMVTPGLNNAFVRCRAYNGVDDEISSMSVLFIIISNEEITSNIKMEYTSLFTGEEIDAALKRSLSNLYDESAVPGTRLIGRYSDDPANLNEVTTPGVYTVHFYTHGPHTVLDVNGTAPIQMTVLNAEDFEGTGKASLFQIITTIAYATEADENESTGISAGDSLYYLFYRDMADPTTEIENSEAEDGYGWHKLLLSEGTMTIIDNLKSEDRNATLSANMGRYLKSLIDQDNVGSMNLLVSSGLRATEFNEGNLFVKQWKQYYTDGNLPTYETNGALFGIQSYASHPKKFTKNGSVFEFNQGNFFYDYSENDYFVLDTTDNSKEYSGNGFQSTYKYGYRIRDEFMPKVLTSDIAFTASLRVTNLIDKTTGALSGDDRYPLVYIDIALYDSNHKRMSTDTIELTRYVDETYIDDNGNIVNYDQTAKNEDTVEYRLYDLPFNEPKRIYVTLDSVQTFINAGWDVKYVVMQFGIRGRGKVRFSDIKLERGTIPTDGSVTLAEMWQEFDNANYIHHMPIDSATVNVNNIDHGQGLVYDKNENTSQINNGYPGKFVAKYLTTGGGGGFVVSPIPPDEHHREVLWYVDGTAPGYVDASTTDTNKKTRCYEHEFYWWDPDYLNNPSNPTGAWVPACIHFYMGANAPTSPNTFWINTNNGKYDANESPDLYYYDKLYSKWRIIGAEPRPCWVIQDEEPTGADADLMWITTSGIASVPYWRPNATKPIWLPIQAIWGNND